MAKTYSEMAEDEVRSSINSLSPPVSSLRHTTSRAEIAHVPIMPLVSGYPPISLSEDPPGNIQYIIRRLDTSKPLTTESSSDMRGNPTAASVRRSIVEHLPMSTTFPKASMDNSEMHIRRNAGHGGI